MGDTHRAAGMLAGLALAWTLTACAGRMQLAVEGPPPSTADLGTISVVLVDQRAAGKGGSDPTVVGFLRNAFGMPFAVRAAADREPSKVVTTLVSQCLEAAGYRVVDPSRDVPRISAVLEEFWSDGYQHNRLWLVMPLELKAGADAAPVWSRELRINEGWTAKTAGFRQMNSGYNKLLETTRNDLLEIFRGPEFRDAYHSL